MESLLQSLSQLSPWQIAMAATWFLLQGCILPSIPEEIVITTLGVLWSQGYIEFPMALAAVLVGLLPANSAAVFIGGRLAAGARSLPWLARAHDSPAVQDALAAVRRHGRLVVAVTRFVPVVRGPVYLACGASGMGVRRFFPVDAAAALVQVPLLLGLGARLGAEAGSLAEALQRVGYLAVGLVLVALAVQLGRRRRRAARARVFT